MNPEKFAEEMWWWEEHIDTWLKENYLSEKDNNLVFRHYSVRQDRLVIRPSVAEALVKKYKAAGWRVKWDDDCHNPDFIFRGKRTFFRR